MTFQELKDELSARGYAHLDDTRLGLLVNRARARLDGLQTWPYRESSGQGLSPVDVPDLAIVEAVTNETQQYPLELSSYDDLLIWYGDLSVEGAPIYAYRAFVDGLPVIATYPTNTDTIGVQYWLRTPKLVADLGTPLAPEDYHLLYVLIAQQAAELERGNYEASGVIQAEVDRQVQEMVNDLLPQQQATTVRMTGASCDG